jgi:zinc finger protein ZFPM1
MSPGSNSRERSLSFSSAISADQFRMEFDAIMEGKENLSVSGDSITPEQIVCAPSLPGSPPLTPSPKRRSHSPRGSSSVSISPSNSSTSHSASQLLMRPLLPADIALRLSDPALNVIPPQMLVKQSMELAMRLSQSTAAAAAAAEATNVAQQISPSHPITSPTGVITPTPIPPQMFIKTGMSKCKECNIVFCKYENYLAHKKHYCSARNLVDDGDSSTKASSSPSANSPPAVSPSGVPLAYQQLICVACGIKFTSLDNLNAHQMYYCPKRTELQAQVVTVHKEKCSKCKTTHDLSQPCTTAGQGAYKCPICEVISPNSSEARRHMETHGGVKAFRCTICRYKGNTLR